MITGALVTGFIVSDIIDMRAFKAIREKEIRAERQALLEHLQQMRGESHVRTKEEDWGADTSN